MHSVNIESPNWRYTNKIIIIIIIIIVQLFGGMIVRASD